jgi:assimilatory nitrate reductase catalytic subunit
MVVLTTQRGRIIVKERLSRDIRFDTLFVPFHWAAEGSANSLTNAAIDPVSKIPEFKVCAVRLERASTLIPACGEPSERRYLN